MRNSYRKPRRRNTRERIVIEQGGKGATYHHTTGFSIYKLDWYPPHSVLAGQQRRTFLDHVETVEEALEKFPTAEVIPGTTYQPPFLNHLPDGPDY